MSSGTEMKANKQAHAGDAEDVWDNNSDTATLRDDRGRTVDTETWGRRR
ncbi:hypothetical protein [Streptomyces erythrochromogenes]|nr:hypothetical protein OG364_00150 [Streptomyces erythrochromogenes]WST98495.1 hypothetical protein OG364_41385 [Streptomyces erythrochromogenes]